MDTPLDILGPLAWPLSLLAGIILALVPGLGRPLGSWRLPLASAAAAVLICAACLLATMPHGDDWTYALSGRDGWAATQAALWSGWSGRYTATALLSLWPQVLPIFGGYPLMALLVAGLALSGGAALAWTLLPQELGRERRCGLTALLLLGAIAGLPSLAEGGAWLAGSITYTLPVGLSTWAWTLLLRPGTGVPGCVGALGLLALAAGGSELVAVANAGGLALAAIAAWRRRDPRLRWWAVAAGVAITGLLASAAAPGNAVRQQVILEGQPAPGLEALAGAPGAAWHILANGLESAGLCAIAACSTTLTATAARRPPGWLAPLLLAVALASAAFLVLPTMLAGTGAPPRAANVIWLAAWGCCAAAAVSAGLWAAGRWRTPGLAGKLGPALPVAAVLLAFLAPGSLGRATADLVLLPGHLRAIADRQLRLEQAAPGSDLDLPLLDPVRTPRSCLAYDLVGWRDDWSNRACAAWYGLRSVRIVVPDHLRHGTSSHDLR